jgi:hypothetical protein
MSMEFSSWIFETLGRASNSQVVPDETGRGFGSRRLASTWPAIRPALGVWGVQRGVLADRPIGVLNIIWRTNIFMWNLDPGGLVLGLSWVWFLLH